MNKSTRRTSVGSISAGSVAHAGVELQGLEARRMMSGSPLSVTIANSDLEVFGTQTNDSIVVTQSGNLWTVSNGSWSRSFYGAFGGLEVVERGGSNSVIFRSSSMKPATMEGGSGNDTLIGGAGDDLLVAGKGNDLLEGMGGNDWIYGGRGNSAAYGGDGNDHLFSGQGNALMVGGAGDDVLVSIGGGTRDSLFGSSGFDSFWADSNSTEIIGDASYAELAAGAVHRVSSFQPLFGMPISKQLLGQELPDPILTSDASSYQYFGDHDLFSTNGPTINDVNQGAVGDCYFLSELAAYAKANPEVIRQSVVDLGDGTFAVRFVEHGQSEFFRVDGELPVNGSGALAYAGFGAQGSVWVAVMEKAWAFARKGDGNYTSINSGWGDEVANALGYGANRTPIGTNGQTFFNEVASALSRGETVQVGTKSTQPANSIMVESHAYTAVAVFTDRSGGQWLVVRNPWGVDGYTCRDGVNDGYVTISMSEAMADLSQVVFAAT